jgi:hypothetical protein
MPELRKQEQAVQTVSFRQACVGGGNSAQLAEKETDSQGDVAIHLGLAGRGRHEMAAAPAFVEGHSPDMDLFAFQRTG